MQNDPNGRRLWAMAHLATPMAIRVAATLGIADLLDEQPSTVEELALACGADRDALDLDLRHLTYKQVLRRDDDGRYQLTELGRPLCSGHPSGIRQQLDIDGAVGRAELAFVHLLHTIRTGQVAYPTLYGRTFWEDLDADPRLATSFEQRMSADFAAARISEIVAGLTWGQYQHVIDVGGGSGALVAALLQAHPQLRGSVVDLPEAAAAARTTFTGAELDDRAQAISGSFFDPLPIGADCYVLSSVLHNWDDGAALRILHRCAEAAGRAGSIIVIERNVLGDAAPGTAMALRMRTCYGGRERATGELRDLLDRAGLGLQSVRRNGELTIIATEVKEARRADTGCDAA